MAYVHVAKIADCLVDATKRKSVGTFAALVLCSEVPFYFGVEAYKKAPTKKKAIMLFETFCKSESNYFINAGGTVNPGSALYVAMADIIAQRQAAVGMNFFQRIRTSANRVPPPGIFDAAQKAVNHQSMLDTDFLAQYNNQKGVPGGTFSRSGPLAKTDLSAKFQAAGFSLVDIGLA